MLGLYLIFLPGIYLKKKTRVVPFVTGIGAAINIVGNLILIPRWGMMGAAWATLMGYLAMAVVLYITVQKFYPVKYQFQRLAKIVFITGLLFIFWKCFGYPILMRIVLLVVCYPLGLVLTRFFTSEEKQRFRTLLSLK
jgi:O-antigen/teichoic acid export membrane protein